MNAQRAQSPAFLRRRLEDYYHAKTDPQVQIGDFEALGNGWETEVYSFTQILHHQADPRILRLYPGADAAAKSAREYQALLKLRRTSGYPVPSVMRHETDALWMGKPFIIMQKIDGLPLGQVMIENTVRQADLLMRFIQLAVDLHRLDDRPYRERDGAADGLAETLGRWRKFMVAERGQGWAAPVLDWLDGQRVADAAQISPLHRDFHPNNVLLTPDDKLYVIDWSGFAVGDYRRDLAWTLLLLSTSGYEHLRPIILSQYARLSGHPVENIEYFEVMAALRRLFDFAASVGGGAESLGMRPETAAVMRQQGGHYQQVYALLREHTGLRLPEIERLIEG